MALKDLLLALVVIVAWGLNFVLIRLGLNDLPPMLLGCLRFSLSALPALFIARPQLPWRWLIAYGVTISLGQFAFLFQGIAEGMPAGLASLVLQSQAFFTLFFAALWLNERIRAINLLGLLVSAAGLVFIAVEGGASVPLVGVLLTLCAGASWALGNVVTRKLGKVDMMGLVVWGSLVPPLPFLALALWQDGPQRVVEALAGIGLGTVAVLVYLAFIATLLGYSLWSRLLSRYPAGQVAPFSLLVPVVGLSSCALLLDEHLTALQMFGCVLVMAGLAVSVFGPRVRGWLAR